MCLSLSKTTNMKANHIAIRLLAQTIVKLRTTHTDTQRTKRTNRQRKNECAQIRKNQRTLRQTISTTSAFHAQTQSRSSCCCYYYCCCYCSTRTSLTRKKRETKGEREKKNAN